MLYIESTTILRQSLLKKITNPSLTNHEAELEKYHLKWWKSYFCFSNPNVSELSHLLDFTVYLQHLHFAKVSTNVLQLCDAANAKWKQLCLWKKKKTWFTPFTIFNDIFSYHSQCQATKSISLYVELGRNAQLALTMWHDLVVAHHWLYIFGLQLPNGKQGTIPLLLHVFTFRITACSQRVPVYFF